MHKLKSCAYSLTLLPCLSEVSFCRAVRSADIAVKLTADESGLEFGPIGVRYYDSPCDIDLVHTVPC